MLSQTIQLTDLEKETAIRLRCCPFGLYSSLYDDVDVSSSNGVDLVEVSIFIKGEDGAVKPFG